MWIMLCSRCTVVLGFHLLWWMSLRRHYEYLIEVCGVSQIWFDHQQKGWRKNIHPIRLEAKSLQLDFDYIGKESLMSFLKLNHLIICCIHGGAVLLVCARTTVPTMENEAHPFYGGLKGIILHPHIPLSYSDENTWEWSNLWWNSYSIWQQRCSQF